jgi:hypothetical protein
VALDPVRRRRGQRRRPDPTAFAHRHQNFNGSSVGLGASEEEFLGHWDDLHPYLDGLYLGFETDRRPERLHDAFPGETRTRLRRLKAQYDPDNVFDQNFPIPPAPREEPASRRPDDSPCRLGGT